MEEDFERISLEALITEGNFERFAAYFWEIRDKNRKVVKFRPNPAQRVMLHKAKEQQAAGKPIRLRVLKYRQAGSSLFWTLWALWWVLTKPGSIVLTLADKKDLPEQWLRRLKGLLLQMGKKCQYPPKPKASNAMELYFSRLGSRYYIGSAEGTTPGMGETISGFHGSEKAFWSNAAQIMYDLLPAIPPGPDTWVVEESTGVSVGDAWYQDYHAAKRGVDDEGRPVDYVAVFLPWFIQPEYNIAGTTWESLGELSERENTTIEDARRYAGEDGQIIGFTGLEPGQLAWRRAMIASEYHGNEDEFANRYPANETEAFLAGGISVFTPDQTRNARKTVRKPVARYDIVLADGMPDRCTMHPNPSGELLVWQEPDKKLHYVVGADSKWGKSGITDWDSAFVECLETGKVVAKVRGKYDLEIWGKLLEAVGFYYNTAILAPERNSTAATVLMPVLLGNTGLPKYPNIWVRSSEIKIPSRAYRPEDYGFLTTQDSKGELIAYAKSATLAGEMDWACEIAVTQMQAYIIDEKAKMRAPDGEHDDDLMARMITAYVASRERRYLEPPEEVEGLVVRRGNTLSDRINAIRQRRK